jgi:hypothetical protein
MLSGDVLAQVTGAISRLCSPLPGHNLRAKRIINSNAARSGKGQGFRFCHAFCDMADHRKSFVLGDVFRRGLDIGIGFLQSETPAERAEEILLEKLINCLKAGKPF